MSYRKKHLKPKFKKLKPKKPFYKKPALWIILLFIIVSTLSYFVLFSWFQVSKINISGNNKVNNQDVESLVRSYVNREIIGIGSFKLYSKNIFLSNNKKLSDNILKEFALIETVKISKKLPDTINLEIKERIEAFAFCNGECFLIDVNGVIFENIKDVLEDKLILRLSENQEYYLGQNVIDKKNIDSILNIRQNLFDNFQIEAKEVIISDTLRLITSEGWSIYFDANGDIDLQISEMNTLLKDQISEDKRKNLQYIYLQYKDRAYYK